MIDTKEAPPCLALAKVGYAGVHSIIVGVSAAERGECVSDGEIEAQIEVLPSSPEWAKAVVRLRNRLGLNQVCLLVMHYTVASAMAVSAMGAGRISETALAHLYRRWGISRAIQCAGTFGTSRS